MNALESLTLDALAAAVEAGTIEPDAARAELALRCRRCTARPCACREGARSNLDEMARSGVHPADIAHAARSAVTLAAELVGLLDAPDHALARLLLLDAATAIGRVAVLLDGGRS